MSEEEKTTVVQEAVADAQPQEEDSSPVAQPSSTAEAEDKTQDRNWREIRRTVEELKNHNYALQAEVAKINAPPQESEPIDPRDDDISTVGETKKLFRKNEKELEKLKEDIKRREAQTVEERVRLKYADYDAVVNKENLEHLFAAAPELVNMLKATNQDPYSQALGAYKLMKKFGVVGEENEKFKENQTKPRSVNSVGQTSALSQANAFSRGLTPDLRKQLWTEMQEAAKKA